jgi:hypothetical protein
VGSQSVAGVAEQRVVAANASAKVTPRKHGPSPVTTAIGAGASPITWSSASATSITRLVRQPLAGLPAVAVRWPVWRPACRLPPRGCMHHWPKAVDCMVGMLMVVRNCTPRFRDGSRGGRAGSGWLSCLDRGAAAALRPDAAPVACAWRRAEVQRSVHARVSRQYHRMSPHAPPPSGTIWFCRRRIPHSQHETTAARCAAKPSADGVPVSLAMTTSPSG